MSRLGAFLVLVVVVVGGFGAAPAAAQWWEGSGAPGSLVSVSVEVEGRGAPLYPSPDGHLRHYFEARAGARYAVVLANRTRERLGVVLTVDGLNAISGERDSGRGRMYVLGPFEQTTVRGWRSSLSEVRRFTFVDEKASYAARSGKANGRMGWIEAAVFREDRPFVSHPCWPSPCSVPRDRRAETEAGRDRHAAAEDEARRENDEARAAEAPPTSAAAPDSPAKTHAESGEAHNRADGLRRAPAPSGGRSYPGTGWGQSTYDPVNVVDFRAEATAAERVTLRYEYRSALRALGILPVPAPGRDRLSERERGSLGFAPPPAW